MWEIHYSDSTFVSWFEYTPFTIPRRMDVIAIIQSDTEHVWTMTPPYDYYMWDKRHGLQYQWFPGDINGLFQYLATPGEKAVLQGTWIDKHAYRRIVNEVNDRIGKKSGYNANEPKF